MNDFKSILARLLEDKDLTQADLCRKTGIPTSLMSNYMKGSKSPALSNAILIAEALNVSLDILSGKAEYVPFEFPAHAKASEGRDILMDSLIKNYDALNPDGKREMVRYSKYLTSCGEYAAIREDAE